jgi:hypothetical protein
MLDTLPLETLQAFNFRANFEWCMQARRRTIGIADPFLEGQG